MLTATILRRVLIGLCIAPSLTGQTATLTPYWPPMEVHTWADRQAHPGAYGRTIRAEISNFGYPDAVFLAGSEPMLMVAPALFFNVVPLPGAETFATTDLCAITRAASNHKLALCGPQGLSLWAGPTPGVLTAVTGSSWQGASTVREVRGTDLLVGVNLATEMVVFADSQTAAQAQPWWVPRLLAAAAFDLDGDGIDEIGIVTKSSVEVRNLSGAIMLTFPGVIQAASAERMKIGTSHTNSESMTALLDVGSNKFLVTVRDGHQELLALPVVDTPHLVVADANADGLDDVILPASTRPSIDVLLNQGATQLPFYEYELVSGVEVTLPFGTAATSNPAIPLVADYDGDGYADLIHPLQANGTIALNSSPFAPNNSATVKYTGIYPTTYSGPYYSGPGYTYLTVSMTHTATPSEATHVELLIYDWNGGSPISKPQWGSRVPFSQLGAPDTITSTPFPTAELTEGALIGILRYVRFENNQCIHAWPATKIITTSSTSLFNTLLTIEGITESSGGTGGATTGGVGDIGKLPPPSPLFGLGG